MEEITRERKKELLKKMRVAEVLTVKQLFKLAWWETFNGKKLDKFFEMLNNGKAARFAFEDAQRFNK
jgi:hypothetical protein